MIPGARVILIAEDGQLLLGRTDGFGSISVPRAVLEGEGSLAILFCKEEFFCGAFSLQAPEFFQYSEHYIGLAPFAVR